MLKIISSFLLLAGAVYASEDAPKLPPLDQAAIDKAIDANLTEANKAYAAYQTAVAKAQDQVVKALEKLKADAMKKGNLPLAIAADSKIKEVRGGSLEQQVTDNSRDDLLGDSAKRVVFDVKAWAGLALRNNIVPLPKEICGHRIPVGWQLSIWVLGAGGGDTNGDIYICGNNTNDQKIGSWDNKDGIINGSGNENDPMPTSAVKVVIKTSDEILMPKDAKIKFIYTSGAHALIIYKAAFDASR